MNCSRHALSKLRPEFSKLDSVVNANDAMDMVTKCTNLITDALHESSKNTACDIKPNNKGPRRVPWWTSECTQARDRTRFWRTLWIQIGRRRDCQVFYIYKYAKKTYRHVRTMAIKNILNNKFNTLSRLFKSGNTKKF